MSILRASALVLLLSTFVLSAVSADAAQRGVDGGDDIVSVLVALAVILVGAKLGGELALRLGQPTVLGELVFGVLAGNLTLIGLNWFEPLTGLDTLRIFAEIGVIVLLFEVGLASDLGEMRKVAGSSFLVAALGVVGPFLLGWGVGIWFYPEAAIYTHIFLGAILTATSIGITARVIKDLGKIDAVESRIILGAAVIDDILGLLILAVISGIIRAADSGGVISSAAVLWLLAKAAAFLTGAIVLGRLTYKWLVHAASHLRVHGMLLITSLAICFITAFVAAKAGLAPIVGSFAAGLVLAGVEYREKAGSVKQTIEDSLGPLALFLVPIFFVTMGMEVDLSTLAGWNVIGFAMVLTLAAILGKQASAFGVISSRRRPVNRWIVGLGMIPRGEVGLIFASIGLSLMYGGEAVVSPELYSAVVIMVILTTLATPPILTWAFRGHSVIK